MSDREAREALFLANLDLVERLIAAVCRRHGLRGDEAADCASWLKLRLVEHDYAILGKFRGESALSTYLTVVVAMLYRDYHVQRWGRWRPSAAARRHGTTAIRLEMLVYRRGYRLDEAAEVLRGSGETTLSDRDLAKLFAELPARSPLRPVEVGSQPLEHVQEGDGEPGDPVVAEEERHDVEQALAGALAHLPPEDRVILRLRYWEGAGVADIARALSLPQKPLYRRLERILRDLRRLLEVSGVSSERVQSLIGELTP